MALLTAEDVLNKKFQVVKFREGYDQVEVDEFLDEVVATVYALQVENGELQEKLEAADRRVAELSSGAPVVVEAPVVEEQVEVEPVVVAEPEPAPAVVQDESSSATSMLALAQRLHDEYVSDGRQEGERIISDARKQGNEIVREAEGKRDSILSQLDQERGMLEGKINELRDFESEYRKSLTGHLESLLQEVSANN